MKKYFAVILIAVLCLVLCGCGQKSERERDFSAAQQTEMTPAPTPVSTPAQEPIPAPAMDEGFAPVMPTGEDVTVILQSPNAGEEILTAAPTPAAEAEAPQALAPVYATKSPTDELVIQGGSAQFVAYAQNSTAVKWFLASPDCGFCVTAAEAPGYFPGLSVSGSTSTRLTLSNIPLALNGWKVQARFEGLGGPVHTNMATVWCITMEEAIARGIVAPPAYGQSAAPAAYPYPYFCPPVFR